MEEVSITFHYNGRLVVDGIFEYIGGTTNTVIIERDMLSMIELTGFLRTFGVSNKDHFWYLKTGFEVANGLRWLCYDDDVLEMVGQISDDNQLHIYVKHNPNEEVLDVTHPIDQYEVRQLEWIDTPDGRHSSSSSSSSDDSECEFQVLDIGGNVSDASSHYAPSSELVPTCASEDEDEVSTHHLEFRLDTDMDMVSFQVGMKFGTKDVLKKAIKEYAVKGLLQCKICQERQGAPKGYMYWRM